ncbi:MAG TPA: hypothetical protein VF765_26415 [Polyangiaceae bacterium]
MAKRAGVTRKVSLSINREDLAMLKNRAKRLHGGNVSAVFADLIAEIRRREAWDSAVAWYGEPLALTDAEKTVIDRELLGTGRKRPRKRRAA